MLPHHCQVRLQGRDLRSQEEESSSRLPLLAAGPGQPNHCKDAGHRGQPAFSASCGCRCSPPPARHPRHPAASPGPGPPPAEPSPARAHLSQANDVWVPQPHVVHDLSLHILGHVLHPQHAQQLSVVSMVPLAPHTGLWAAPTSQACAVRAGQGGGGRGGGQAQAKHAKSAKARAGHRRGTAHPGPVTKIKSAHEQLVNLRYRVALHEKNKALQSAHARHQRARGGGGEQAHLGSGGAPSPCGRPQGSTSLPAPT